MSPEKWQQIKGQVQDQFKDAEVVTEDLGEEENGEKEILTFTGPVGKMKLEYITRPVVIDKKTHGSRRIGSHTDVEYVYSDTEFSHSLKAYKWDENDQIWVEIDLKGSFTI
ncbi:MAG: hypothetical protein WCV92_03345 [Candidatus Buchananbacteria bacterium]